MAEIDFLAAERALIAGPPLVLCRKRLGRILYSSFIHGGTSTRQVVAIFISNAPCGVLATLWMARNRIGRGALTEH